MWEAPAFFLALHLWFGVGTVLGPLVVSVFLDPEDPHNLHLFMHKSMDNYTQNTILENNSFVTKQTPMFPALLNHTDAEPNLKAPVSYHHGLYRYPFIFISTIAFLVAISFFISGCMNRKGKKGEKEVLLGEETTTPAVRTTIQGRGATVYFLTLCMAMLFFQGGTEVAFSGLLAMYTTKGLHMSTFEGYMLNEIFWGSILAFRLLAILLSYFVNFKVQIPCSLSLAFASMAVLCFAVTDHPVVIWVATTGFGLACSVMIQNLILLVNEYMSFSSRIASLSVAPLFLGSTVLSAITGNVMVTFGMHTFPILFFTYVCISSVLYLIYHFSKPIFQTSKNTSIN